MQHEELDNGPDQAPGQALQRAHPRAAHKDKRSGEQVDEVAADVAGVLVKGERAPTLPEGTDAAVPFEAPVKQIVAILKIVFPTECQHRSVAVEGALPAALHAKSPGNEAKAAPARPLNSCALDGMATQLAPHKPEHLFRSAGHRFSDTHPWKTFIYSGTTGRLRNPSDLPLLLFVKVRLLVAQLVANLFDHPIHLLQCPSNVHGVEFAPRGLVLDRPVADAL